MPEKLFSMMPVILVIDDQATDALLLSNAISDLGQVQFVTDGQSAIDLARQICPDVVLLDIQMPGLSGFAVCKALKSDPKTCRAAVIFVTSHTQTENELQALELGGIDFLQKPLNVPVARAHIKAHLALSTEAKRLSTHDALTGLPNRSLLQDRAEHALEVARRKDGQVAMILLDLDHFKTINDSASHGVGDLLLKEIATRLCDCSRPVDTVSRQGGDEFIILMPLIDDIEAVANFTVRLLARITEPLTIKGETYNVAASLGVSVFPHDSHSLESLYRHADAAMYQAKQQGRNRCRFFSADIEKNTRARRLLEQNLREAAAGKRFEVFYQPKVDAQSNRVVGLEALVRWRQSDTLIASPDQFISVAEETGLIIPIGKQVLIQACHDVKWLHEQGFKLSISVNISAIQFAEPDFLQLIEAALADSGLEADYLELEITEGVLAKNIDATRNILSALKALGTHISIDDFGTGYSSLAYLKSFPIDVLKIDQSFVRDMLVDANDVAIIQAIITLAHTLGLGLVAEGVESEGQAQALLAQGCTIMQGFHYSRAIPLTELFNYLNDQQRRGIVTRDD